MATSGAIKIGQIVFLPLAATPPTGDLSSLTYHSTPEGIVSRLPVLDPSGKPTGLQIKGLAAGVTVVDAKVNGVNASGQPAEIVGICNITVAPAIPLVTALVLGPPA